MNWNAFSPLATLKAGDVIWGANRLRYVCTVKVDTPPANFAVTIRALPI